MLFRSCGQLVEKINGDDQLAAEQWFTTSLVFQPEDIMFCKKMIRFKQLDHLEPFFKAGGCQKKGNSFASGQKPAVCIALPSAKLGKGRLKF